VAYREYHLIHDFDMFFIFLFYFFNGKVQCVVLLWNFKHSIMVSVANETLFILLLRTNKTHLPVLFLDDPNGIFQLFPARAVAQQTLKCLCLGEPLGFQIVRPVPPRNSRPAFVLGELLRSCRRAFVCRRCLHHLLHVLCSYGIERSQRAFIAEERPCQPVFSCAE